MKKFKDTEKTHIEEHRKIIIELQSKQDEIYEKLLTELGELDTETEDWLFEWVFNCSNNTNQEYLNSVKDRLFDSDK